MLWCFYAFRQLFHPVFSGNFVPKQSIVMRKLSAKPRVYRPALIERPSMKKFVTLSILLHIWAVALFGDTVGTAGRVAQWGSTFTASLGARAPSPTIQPKQNAVTTAKSATSASNTKPTPTEPTQTPPISPTPPTPAPSATAATATPPIPINIEPIAVIAVETNKPTQDFVVPPLAVAPLEMPATAPAATSTTFAAVPLLVPQSVAPVSESSAVLYVPPIIERATVTLADIEVVRPSLPTLPTPPQATKEFLPYTPPAVVPPAPVAIVTPAVVPAPVPPPTPIVPPTLPAITPIERLSIPQPAAAEFMPNIQPAPASLNVESPSTARPSPTPSATPTQTPSAASTTISGNEKNNVPDKSATATRASTSDATTSLLPLVPVIPAAPPTATPKLDLDSLRQRARTIDSESGNARTLLPFPTVAKPAEKRNIEKIFDKALKRPDCKDEYANMGLAAVVPLVRDAIKGDGCKW